MERTAGLAVLFRGTVIDSASRSCLRVLADCVLGVDVDGHVMFAEADHKEKILPGGVLVLSAGDRVPLAGVEIHVLPPRAFLCPGLVDTHTHAPQFAFAGLGYDLQLLEWLRTYTFPSEAKFADLNYAASVCTNAVRRTLLHGTTSCVYFGTIHTDAAVLLGATAARHGQRSFVGKVNMDRNSPEYYCETTEESIRETERFVSLMLAAGEATGCGVKAASAPLTQQESQLSRLAHVVSSPACTSGLGCVARGVLDWAVRYEAGAKAEAAAGGPKREQQRPLGPAPVPVITPRFVPTCSSALMTALGEIAQRHQLLVQSHVSENSSEIEWVRSLHPESDSYTGVYDDHGLLGPRTLLAHGVFLEAAERELLRARGATVSHCPLSNAMLCSGMLNVRRLLDEGVSVALGTDVSGGSQCSILSAIRETLKVSNMVSLYEGAEFAPLSYAEAFWLATVSGARSLGVRGLTGDLSVGSVFDAIVVDPDAPNSPFDLYEGDAPIAAFQKWLQLGDDRNTNAIFVNGSQVFSREESRRA